MNPQFHSLPCLAANIRIKSVRITDRTVTFLNKETLRRVRPAEVELEVESIWKLRVFDKAAANADGGKEKIICTKTVSIDTELQIRHGSTLRLRNLKRLLTEQCVCYPLFRPPILETRGRNTWDQLAASADQFCGGVDAWHLIGSFTDNEDDLISKAVEFSFIMTLKTM